MTTKRFNYSSPANISFRGMLDTGIELHEWSEWSESDKQEYLTDLVFDQLVWLEDAEGNVVGDQGA